MFGWHWSAPILLNELWPTEFVSMSFVQSFGRVAFSFGDIDAVAIKLLSAGLLHRVGTCRAPPFLGRSFITPENTCVVCWAFIGSRLSLATVPYRNYANLAVPRAVLSERVCTCNTNHKSNRLDLVPSLPLNSFQFVATDLFQLSSVWIAVAGQVVDDAPRLTTLGRT